MRESKHATRRDKFDNLIGDEREAAIAQAQQNARARVELFEGAHRPNPDSLANAKASGATGLAMASSSASSSLVRNPNGFTTGITF